MLIFPRRRLVLLAMPKCGSTAVEAAVGSVAAIRCTGGGLKHTSMADFERFWQPMLAHVGHPRESYEVVCLFREPLDWLHSWWRYRSREQLRGHPDRAGNFTGDLSFEAFAQSYLDDSVRLDGGDQSAFVRGMDGRVGVDRVFRYEDMDRFVDFLQDRVGREVRMRRVNVSPVANLQLSQALHGRLVEHLRPDYEIYDGLTG